MIHDANTKDSAVEGPEMLGSPPGDQPRTVLRCLNHKTTKQKSAISLSEGSRDLCWFFCFIVHVNMQT